MARPCVGLLVLLAFLPPVWFGAPVEAQTTVGDSQTPRENTQTPGRGVTPLYPGTPVQQFGGGSIVGGGASAEQIQEARQSQPPNLEAGSQMPTGGQFRGATAEQIQEARAAGTAGPLSVRSNQTAAATGSQTASTNSGSSGSLSDVGLGYRYGGYGGGYGGAAGSGSIFGSSAAGLGELIRGQAAYNLLTSRAAVNLTEAQRQQIENAEQWTKAYFELRRLNDAYRAAERLPRPTYEDLVRFAGMEKPARLSPSELDLVTGDIVWPVLLRADKYREYRGVLEQLFASRAATGAISAEGYLTLDQVTNALLAELQKDVASLPPQDYLRAKNFIQSLAYEASLPMG